jgi:hypothetical protein
MGEAVNCQRLSITLRYLDPGNNSRNLNRIRVKFVWNGIIVLETWVILSWQAMNEWILHSAVHAVFCFFLHLSWTIFCVNQICIWLTQDTVQLFNTANILSIILGSIHELHYQFILQYILSHCCYTFLPQYRISRCFKLHIPVRLIILHLFHTKKRKSILVTGPVWPRDFQAV